MRLSLLLMLSLTTVIYNILVFINKYIFSDWNFIGFLLVMVILDTLTGIIRAYKLRNVFSMQLRGLFRKIIEYGIALIVTHVLCSYQGEGSQSTFVQYVIPSFDSFMKFLILAAEALSINENLKAAGYRGIFPDWMQIRMKNVKETGKLPTEPENQPL